MTSSDQEPEGEVCSPLLTLDGCRFKMADIGNSQRIFLSGRQQGGGRTQPTDVLKIKFQSLLAIQQSSMAARKVLLTG